MTETKHTPTPGPWRAGDPIIETESGLRIIPVYGPHENGLLRCVCAVTGHDAVGIANAEYIVRACNNFEQLAETLEECGVAIANWARLIGTKDPAKKTQMEQAIEYNADVLATKAREILKAVGID